jgi:hypothetical protein
MTLATLVVMALAVPGAEARGDVSMTLANGRVTLIARNATPRQILEEWARRGQIRIVNAERLAGGPDTIVLTNEPESNALAIVLQSAAGYIAAPRRVPMANASMYDRILIMPSSVASPAPAYRAAAPQPMMPQEPTVFEVPPDPSALANDDGSGAPAPAAGAVFQQGDPNGVQPGMAPPPTQNALTPYLPPPDPNAEPAPPPTVPQPSQQTTTLPGVLPVPPPSQQQQPR